MNINTQDYSNLSIYNGTYEIISIYNKVDRNAMYSVDFSGKERCIQKPTVLDTTSPIATIEQDKPLNCGSSIDPLPEGYDLYIVTSAYRAYSKQQGLDTSKLAVLSNPVYDVSGSLAGFMSLLVG